MYIVFDIGGTKMRLATSKDGSTLDTPHIVPTPKKFDRGIEVFTKVAKQLSRGTTITALCGSIASPLDENKTLPLHPPNLPQWTKKPLKEKLEKSLNAPVFLENDATLAGLGEAVHGAGREYAIVAYLTIGTGVGGVRIVNGEIDESSLGSEPGHQIIDITSKRMCTCGGFGHLEALVGGASIEKFYHKKPEHIDDPKFWDEIARILAYGLHDTIVHWSSEIVVLGGSLMNKIPLDSVRNYLNGIMKIFHEIPKIKKGTFGDLAGLYGALTYLRQRSTV